MLRKKPNQTQNNTEPDTTKRVRNLVGGVEAKFIEEEARKQKLAAETATSKKKKSKKQSAKKASSGKKRERNTLGGSEMRFNQEQVEKLILSEAAANKKEVKIAKTEEQVQVAAAPPVFVKVNMIDVAPQEQSTLPQQNITTILTSIEVVEAAQQLASLESFFVKQVESNEAPVITLEEQKQNPPSIAIVDNEVTPETTPVVTPDVTPQATPEVVPVVSTVTASFFAQRVTNEPPKAAIKLAPPEPSALHIAINNLNYNEVKNLLALPETAAHLNEFDNTNRLPLTIAIEKDDPKMVNLLVEAGADICKRTAFKDNAWGLSPLDLVRAEHCNSPNRADMARIILKAYERVLMAPDDLPVEGLLHRYEEIWSKRPTAAPSLPPFKM